MAVSNAEFCERFTARLLTYLPDYDGTEVELRSYAMEVAPTYIGMPDEEDRTPEDWADADALEWEEGF